MNILVIGGTRFFGIHMVNELLTAGHDVTIATRGKYFCFDRDGNESIYYDTGICEDQHDDNSAWCCNQYHS